MIKNVVTNLEDSIDVICKMFNAQKRLTLKSSYYVTGRFENSDLLIEGVVVLTDIGDKRIQREFIQKLNKRLKEEGIEDVSSHLNNLIWVVTMEPNMLAAEEAFTDSIDLAFNRICQMINVKKQLMLKPSYCITGKFENSNLLIEGEVVLTNIGDKTIKRQFIKMLNNRLKGNGIEADLSNLDRLVWVCPAN